MRNDGTWGTTERGEQPNLESIRKTSFCMHLMLLTVLAVPTFLTSLACRGPRQNVDAGAAPQADGFSLVLNNHQVLDANIFVQHDGQVDRVGMVSASSSKSLVLPLWLLGQSRLIRLIAEPIGSDARFTSDFLSVQPGQMVELNVEGVLERSNYNIQ